MADRLASIKGRFMISLDDTPEVTETFARFLILPVSLTYSVAGGNGKSVGEVIILDGKEPRIANLPIG